MININIIEFQPERKRMIDGYVEMKDINLSIANEHFKAECEASVKSEKYIKDSKVGE